MESRDDSEIASWDQEPGRAVRSPIFGRSGRGHPEGWITNLGFIERACAGLETGAPERTLSPADSGVASEASAVLILAPEPAKAGTPNPVESCAQTFGVPALAGSWRPMAKTRTAAEAWSGVAAGRGFCYATKP